MKTSYKGFAVGDQVKTIFPLRRMIDGRSEMLPPEMRGVVVRVQPKQSRAPADKYRCYLVVKVELCREEIEIGIEVDKVQKIKH
ncbi:hypothetical protein [Gulbenkiania mobilis]|uniref:hypothetical protein n=1 Tax=Gulbenkiania mobilis TaxID=397457 RepID=UPI0006BBCE1A|nr:hypothetical protein [Gulbenkiania mobilis]